MPYLNGVGQSRYIGQTQNGPFLVPESPSYDLSGNKNTIKLPEHGTYFEVSTKFLGYFWSRWGFSPSNEHFQTKTSPNLDLVWHEILEFAGSLRHSNIIIIIYINWILYWNTKTLGSSEVLAYIQEIPPNLAILRPKLQPGSLFQCIISLQSN